MKYLFAIGLLLAACEGCGHVPHSERPDTLSQPAVALLEMTGKDGSKEGTCSAWKVSDELVATAGHCCSQGWTYVLKGPSAVAGADVTMLVDMKPDNDSKDWERDICILRGRLTGPPAPIAPADPEIGGHIWTLGFPRGHFLISEGIWSGRTGEGDYGICSTVGVGGGSGSPILDSQSRVVGIHVAGWRFGDNMSLVATLENLRVAINRAQVLLKAAAGTE